MGVMFFLQLGIDMTTNNSGVHTAGRYVLLAAIISVVGAFVVESLSDDPVPLYTCNNWYESWEGAADPAYCKGGTEISALRIQGDLDRCAAVCIKEKASCCTFQRDGDPSTNSCVSRKNSTFERTHMPGASASITFSTLCNTVH